MTDLVVVSLEVWDDVWRRNQHLVAGLLKTGVVQRVLFVEPGVDALHDLRRGRRPGTSDLGLRRIDLPGVAGGELWAARSLKLLPRRLDKGGDQRRARTFAQLAKKVGMSRPVLWVNDPVGAELMEFTGWPSLYDITDDWLVADRPSRELRRLASQEQSLLERCREVVVCSEALRRTKSAARPVTLIPNAVDVAPYRMLQERPADLPPGPVALYLGTVHRDRIDVPLVVNSARRIAGGECPGSLVLVGPAPLPETDLIALRDAGVHVLGPRPSAQVPAYLQHADVLIVPHVLTDFTASLDPIKAYEYRAAGRPVLSTPVPGFHDSPDASVTTTPAHTFPDVLADALSRQSEWSDAGTVDVPTWGTRVHEMAEVIQRVAGVGSS